MSIRRAAEADTFELERLSREGTAGALALVRHGEQPARWVPATDHVVLLAELGGRAVGYLVAGPSPDADTGRWCATLLAMRLAPEGRGHHLGDSMWGALPEPLARVGYRSIAIWAGSDEARLFLERWGFGSDGLAEGPRQRFGAGLPDLAFAEGLATALDDEHFDLAARFLDENVSYETGREVLQGPDRVVASYRQAALQARRALHELVNESRVEAVGGQRFRVHYTDRLRHNGHVHAFRCQQVLSIPPGQGVTRIVHRELPGERQRLQAFFRRASVVFA